MNENRTYKSHRFYFCLLINLNNTLIIINHIIYEQVTVFNLIRNEEKNEK